MLLAEPSARRTPVKLDVGMLTHDLKTLPDYARKVEAHGLRLPLVVGDPARSLSAARPSPPPSRRASSSAPTSPTVFSRSPMITAHIAWDLQKASAGRFIARARHPGQGAQRAALLGEVRVARAEDGGGHPAPSAPSGTAGRTGPSSTSRGSSTRFDLMTPFFNPGPIEHPKIPIYIAAVNPLHVPDRGRAVRRHARAPVQQPEVPARVRPPGGRGGAREVRAAPARTSPTRPPTFVVVGDTEEERAEQAPRRSSSRSPSTARRAPTSPCSRRTAGRT